PRVEVELAHHERELDVLVVLGPDLDRPAPPPDMYLLRGLRETERIGVLAQPPLDRRVAPMLGEARLLLHAVLELHVVPVRLADVEREVRDRRHDEDREQAAERALPRAPVHHCDCAPSMTSLTMRSIACWRPCASPR